jgi:1-acyl-sn-glycerol-3-phosphate acyltransferase
MNAARTRSHRIAREAMCSLTRFLVGAYPTGVLPRGSAQTVFVANHTSHLDTLTLLAALSLRVRSRTRPVAARDYWCAGPFRRWIAEKVLNVVFIDRQREGGGDPLEPLRDALRESSSLILFPEGTRGDSPMPAPFKSGLFWLLHEFPEVSLSPVYLENLHRVLPKGASLPLPLINRVHFGPMLDRVNGEGKDCFLERAHAAVCQLCPGK